MIGRYTREIKKLPQRCISDENEQVNMENGKFSPEKPRNSRTLELKTGNWVQSEAKWARERERKRESEEG